jgi:hypothetical protein
MSYNPNSIGTPTIARAGANQQTNATGTLIPKGTAIRLTALGAALIDVSDETSANSIAGVVRTNLSNGSVGEVITSGTIQDIASSFAISDVVYVGSDGNLTNIKPSEGSNGFEQYDWVIRVGVIAANVSNSALQDLLVNIQIVGQL